MRNKLLFLSVSPYLVISLLYICILFLKQNWQLKCLHDISLGFVAIFDRSGRYVITGSDNRLVKIWSMETAFCLASCHGQVKNVYIVCHTQFFLLLLNVQTPFIPFFAHLLFSILLKGWHYWLGRKFKQCFGGICFKWLQHSSFKNSFQSPLNKEISHIQYALVT